MLPNRNRIAGKPHGFLFPHGNKPRFLQSFVDGPLPVAIKCRRKPQQLAAGQRTKACIEMIETQIDELHRDNLAVYETRDVFVGANIRALAVPSEFERLKSQKIPGAFERYILR